MLRPPSQEAHASPILAVERLCKRYGRLNAVNGLSLSVFPGETYAFLGRNGAGKTTAIRIIMGISEAGGGAVRILGEQLGRNRIKLRQEIGYVAQEQYFYGWMTPQSIGHFVGGLYPTWDADAYARLLQMFELPASQKIRGFSGGMKAKLGLALALAHRPPLLVLDEPTAGLDAVARREFLTMVVDQAVQFGQTTFFSTHQIDEVEGIADRVGIIDRGAAIYEGKPDDLLERMRILRGPIPASGQDAPWPAPLEGISGGIEILQDRYRHGQREVVLRTSDPRRFEVLSDLPEAWRLSSLSLEEAFIELVTRSGRGVP